MLSVVVNIGTLLLYIVVCCRYCYHGQPKYSEIIDTTYDIRCFRGANAEFLDKMESDPALLYTYLLFLLLCC